MLSGITLATKMIQAKVRRAGLIGILGAADSANVHGEAQQKLDVYSNEALLETLSVRETVGIVASEENEEPIVLNHGSNKAKYGIVSIH
jgi:fructose-1,6-bisphosphatase I